jgi:hypothetical protein
MTLGFEVSGGPHLLEGEITHASIHEAVDEIQPTTIIRTDQEWFVHLKWELRGSLVAMVDGEWHIQAYLESMGTGFEGELKSPGDTLPVNPGSPLYEHRFRVPAGTVEAGSYKLVTHISYVRPDGLPGPMAGFYEVPLVRFYDPGPPGP